MPDPSLPAFIAHILAETPGENDIAGSYKFLPTGCPPDVDPEDHARSLLAEALPQIRQGGLRVLLRPETPEDRLAGTGQTCRDLGKLPAQERKQVILIRRDLKMRRGKEIAQGAHACLKVVLENRDHPDVQAWLAGAFTKIALSVDSEVDLLDLVDRARQADIPVAAIQDAGRTEFSGRKTWTAAAIGPAAPDRIDDLTGHLKLR